MNTHEQTNSSKTPFFVFSGLILLTIVTVLLSGLNVGDTGAIIIAMSVASIKAILVLNYFMHLNHEPLIFKLFVGLAFITMLTLFLLTFSDYSFRGVS